MSAGRDQILYLPDLSSELNGYVVKRRWNASLVSQNWSVVGDAGGIAFSDANSPETTVFFSEAGIYTLQLEVVTDQQTIRDEVRIEVREALADGTGLLTREVWYNRYFTTLAQLRASEEFPDQPHIVDSLPSLRGPTNWSSKYATRVTGWLHPPPTAVAGLWRLICWSC